MILTYGKLNAFLKSVQHKICCIANNLVKERKNNEKERKIWTIV